ncbi:MAG: LamG domain-containing protein [Sedimentisphaerales bacterium]|nr:LamG domain-containing protein [Sedimentisphaerales bacterium]
MTKRGMCLVLWIVLVSAVGLARADLVAHWRLDETSGNVAVDDSGNGNDGTLRGDPQWVAGRIGGALEFDGTGDYVDCGNDAIFDITEEITLAVWVNANDMLNGEHNHWLGKGDNTYAIKHQSGNNIEFFIYDGDWHSINYTTDIGSLNGEWHHMAGTFDGTEMKLYIDGEEADTLAFSGSIGTATHNVTMGENSQATGRFFDGMLDDARIYDEALSAEEIAGVMMAEPVPYALGPNPTDGSVLDQRSAALQWRAGAFAASHNVYFGESLEDVDQGLAEAVATTEASLSTADIAAYAGGLTPGQTYYWRVDEVNDVHADSPWRGDVWSFRVRPLTAWNPSPTDGVSYVRLDADLDWESGLDVLFHTLYFSESFDEVNQGVGGGYMTVAVGFDPGPLEVGTTYYWRVDEFARTAITTRGEIWSFTTVPEVQVSDPDLIGWWTLDEGQGTTAVDWSGHGNHGAFVGSPQWTYGVQGSALQLSDGAHVEIPAVNVETNTVTMTAWVKRQGNQSDWAAVLFSREGSGVSGMGFGPSNELRYHWMDLYWDFTTGIIPPDREWFFMALVVEPTQATLYYNGTETFVRNEAAHDPDPFDNVIRIGRDWAGRDLAGTVDDVRFYNKVLSEAELLAVMRGNPLLAWNPRPAPDAVVDIRTISSLSWSAGDAVASHNVYFGSDGAAVAAAGTDAPEYQGNQAGTVFSVAGLVALGGGDYFWRIDEVAADETVQTGTVWKFTAPAYVLVDNFESYTNEVGSRVFEKWIDGVGFTQPVDTPGNGTGALVGHDIWTAGTPFTTIMETSIVHGDGQSMPLYYDNTEPPYRSEADRTWLVAENWQVEGVTDLRLYVRGESDNDAAALYVVIEDSAGNAAVVPHSDAAATTATDWIEWKIPLADLTAAGVNIASVRKMSIGVGSRTAPTPGGAGVIYVDDIRVTAAAAGE